MTRYSRQKHRKCRFEDFRVCFPETLNVLPRSAKMVICSRCYFKDDVLETRRIGPLAVNLLLNDIVLGADIQRQRQVVQFQAKGDATNSCDNSDTQTNVGGYMIQLKGLDAD
jgi:hypothetical protein